MKKHLVRFFLIQVMVILLASCSPSKTPILPTTATTATPSIALSPTSAASLTLTPSPTLQPEPTATPLILINKAFSQPLPQALYFLAKGQAGYGQVFRLAPDGRSLRQLTFTAAGVWEYAVSPLGDLAFVTGEGLTVWHDRRSELIVPAANRPQYLHWSPDGNLLVYLTHEQEDVDTGTGLGYTNFLLMLYDMRTQAARILLSTRRDATNPITARITNSAAQQAVENQTWSELYQVVRWTPDGRYLLVFASEFWYRYDLQNGSAVAIDLLGKYGEISPDGNTVFLAGAFYIPESTVTICRTPDALVQVDIQAGTVTQLLDCPGWDPEAILYLPDQQVIYFIKHEYVNSITRLYALTLGTGKSGPRVIQEWGFSFITDPLYVLDGSLLISNWYADTRELVILPTDPALAVQRISLPFQDRRGGGAGSLQWGPASAEDEAAIAGLTPTPAATLLPACPPGFSKLTSGGSARVATGDATVRVRSGPSKADEVIVELYPDTVVKVEEGPVCADGLFFWRVTSDLIPGGSGWVAEGDGTEYYLESVAPKSF